MSIDTGELNAKLCEFPPRELNPCNPALKEPEGESPIILPALELTVTAIPFTDPLTIQLPDFQRLTLLPGAAQPEPVVGQ